MDRRKIIWFAIAFGTVIYMIILLVAHPHPPATPLDVMALPLEVEVLYAMALMSFIVGWILPGRMANKTPQDRLVYPMAIFESVAIFGLISAFMTADWRLYLGPWALAIAGFIRSFPRDESEARPGSM